MTEPAPAPAPLSPALHARLAAMMALQYAIWGAWLPLFWSFLTKHRGLSPEQAGNLFAIGAVGAVVAPFVAGQIADRWFRTERFLAVSHLLGAALVWQLARLESYGELVVFALLYSLIYSPTVPLTNALAFHHVPDRDRDFGKVRLWGTVGWIIAGIGIGQWLLHVHTPDVAVVGEAAVRRAQVAGMADAFRMSAVLGAVLGLYCLALPRTPPAADAAARFAPGNVLGAVVRRRALLALFLVSFPMACVHQFYFVHTAEFLAGMEMRSPTIDAVFGVGGGGLMTIGQMAEIAVLALLPRIAARASRKALLATGLAAYVLRFAVFAWLPAPWAVLPALALHGLCFGCFFFVAFLIVDEETPPDARASAQGLYNLVVIGFGIIAGNVFAGRVAAMTTSTVDGATRTDWTTLFGIPAALSLACMVALVLAYPAGRIAGRPREP